MKIIIRTFERDTRNNSSDLNFDLINNRHRRRAFGGKNATPISNKLVL